MYKITRKSFLSFPPLILQLVEHTVRWCIARLLVSEVVRSFEAFLTVVDFIEFILKSSLWPYKSWCCLGKFLISLWHCCCFKSLRVSIVRLLLCGCRTITVPVIKSCRVTIVGLLLCSYRTTVRMGTSHQLSWRETNKNSPNRTTFS